MVPLLVLHGVGVLVAVTEAPGIFLIESAMDFVQPLASFTVTV